MSKGRGVAWATTLLSHQIEGGGGVDVGPHSWHVSVGIYLDHLLGAVVRQNLGVWGLGFGVWGLGFGVWGLGFGVWGLGFGV